MPAQHRCADGICAGPAGPKADGGLESSRAGFAYAVDSTSWEGGFALAAIGPLVGWWLLGRLPDSAP